MENHKRSIFEKKRIYFFGIIESYMEFIGLLILIASVILHEIMHGYVAEKLGDPTARHAGRITLNPIPHIDPLMTILLPGVLLLSGSPIIFGAAKPVPVNPLFLKDGRKDMALVALAGPLTNLALAAIAAILFAVLYPQLNLYEVSMFIQTGLFSFNEATAVIYILSTVVFLNIVLGVLNLIPIPPLDGSKLFSIIFPEEIALKYLSLAPFGLFMLFALLYLTPLRNWFSALIIQALRLFGAF